MLFFEARAASKFAAVGDVDPYIFKNVSVEMEKRIEVLRNDAMQQIIKGKMYLGANNPYVYVDLRETDGNRSTYRYVRERVVNEMYEVFVEDLSYTMEVTETSLEMDFFISWTKVKFANEGIMRDVNRAARINFNRRA